MAGQVPTLYTNKTNRAEGGLHESPDKAHADLTRIEKGLFMPEFILLEAAGARYL